MPPSASTAAKIDPTAIMRIKDLQLRARAIVEGFQNGLHRSPYHGFSVEFNEYRPYTHGDDPRSLDWKLYARSDRYFVKKFEDETNRRCHLVVDQSRSMGYTSIDYDKADYARTIAATLAYFLSSQRDGVGLVTFDEKIDQVISARHRPGHLRQLMVALSRPLSGASTNLNSPLEQLAKIVSQRGLVIVISDLLVPIETIGSSLSLLRSRGHEVIVLRTLDRGEMSFSATQPGMIVDIETGRELYIDPAIASRLYDIGFKAHSQQIKSICDSLGIDLFEIITDQSLEKCLYDIVTVQHRRGRQVARRGSAAVSLGTAR